jgi:hypothetical protein
MSELFCPTCDSVFGEKEPVTSFPTIAAVENRRDLSVLARIDSTRYEADVLGVHVEYVDNILRPDYGRVSAVRR